MMGYLSGTNLLFSPTLLHAKEPDFEQYLETSKQGIKAITSNDQAQAFIQKTMGPFVEATLVQPARGRRKHIHPLPALLIEKMMTLAQKIAMWHYSSDLEKQLDQETEPIPPKIRDLSPAHLSWLKNNSQETNFHRVFMLAKTYADLAKTEDSVIAELPHFALYAQYLYQTYPPWQKEKAGLVHIAEKEGAQGILQRLQEYWGSKASEANQPLPSVKNQELYAARYLHQHFLPYLQPYLRTAVLQLQRDSKRHAREIWRELRKWQNDQTQKNGLLRLCGTWQWLIHNHQNHGDHKTVMVYPPPSQYDRMDPQPAKIQVQGDTVYIRWEFPRGIIQEESLLFSEKDRALSGTFMNNLGPNGNITARRMKPCHKK